MIKPNMPNIPGIGAMTDTLDFVKNLWGSMGIPGMSMPTMPGMNVPGMVMPTLSVEEINKKISDLKTVESWLGLNMTMLRSTIQALEVQAATISTLQSMGESFTASMTPPSAKEKSTGQGMASVFANAGNGAAGTSTGAPASEKMHGAPEPTSKDESDAASLTAPLVNAAAWWNILQDQFKQAVSNAMVEVPMPATATPASEKPKARPKAKAEPAAPASAAPRKRKTSK